MEKDEEDVGSQARIGAVGVQQSLERKGIQALALGSERLTEANMHELNDGPYDERCDSR